MIPGMPYRMALRRIHAAPSLPIERSRQAASPLRTRLRLDDPPSCTSDA